MMKQAFLWGLEVAGSLNKVTLLGNLVRDPEVRHTTEGGKIVTLSVATSESWKDKATGERKEKAEYHRVVIFNERLSDVADQYLKKGRKVYFEGQLQTRKWTDQSGQDRYVTEVVLPRYRGELLILDRGGEAASSAPAGQTERSDIQPIDSTKVAALDDDDIPF